MKKTVLLLSLVSLFSVPLLANPTTPTSPPPASQDVTRTREQMREEIRAQFERVRNACAPDVANAGCASEQGRKAIKCVQKFKKRNKDFQVSEPCKNALAEGKALRKQIKMSKKERKRH